MVGSVVWMCESTLHVLFGRRSWLLQWRTVARPVNLAQASQSRLSEMKQGARLGGSLNFWASRQLAQARGISLKRDPALPMLLLLCPRLGEGEARLSEHVSPERDPSAWARCWARQCCDWDVWWFPRDLSWLSMIVWWWICI